MISKGQIKLISSLEQKKNRVKNGLFIVEGTKGIEEILSSGCELNKLFTTQPIFNSPANKTELIDEKELKKISYLKTPQTALAIFNIPQAKEIEKANLVLVLDGIRDPGNLGTIIRLCDWFGIKDLVCSKDTVDCYNNKVVQATMGSIVRVNISYLDLIEFFSENTSEIFGTYLEGENVYNSQLPASGFLVLGNEANGISEELKNFMTRKLNIPQFGKSQDTESLNVATATAILLSEFKRRSFTEK